jgi:cell division transport system permease protein
MALNLSYATREAFANFGSARLLTWLATGTITVALFLFGVFLLGTINLDKAITQVQEKVEVVAFLREGLDVTDVRSLGVKIGALEGVARVNFISKEEAMQRFREELKGNQDLLDAMEANPLPASFQIRVAPAARNPDRVRSLALEIGRMSGVEEVEYGQEWIERLYRMIRVFVGIDIGLFIVVILSSGLVVFNTIRMTVVARKEAIEIMRLVGATGWFIRLPFLLEGVIQGALGGFTASLILFVGYRLLVLKVPGTVFLPPSYYAVPLLFGAFLGFVGSGVAVQRFLK